MVGNVKFFKQDKNWGFITDKSGKDVFFHKSNVEGSIVLEEAQEVEFELEVTDRGHKAIKINVVL